MHSKIYKYTRPYMYTFVCMHAYAYVNAFTYTHTCIPHTHANIQMHTLSYARTHARHTHQSGKFGGRHGSLGVEANGEINVRPPTRQHSLDLPCRVLEYIWFRVLDYKSYEGVRRHYVYILWIHTYILMSIVYLLCAYMMKTYTHCLSIRHMIHGLFIEDMMSIHHEYKSTSWCLLSISHVYTWWRYIHTVFS